jgi:sialate O-acetylesterase
LAITTDVGDAIDIHPKDKKEVGERLALCALANHYGKKIAFRGPTLADVERLPGGMKLKSGNSVAEKLPGALKLTFTNADGGLVVKGEKLGEFAVAGEDRKWSWADAKIEGDAVIVSSADVPKPVYVRYAWQANPLATLFNGAGLPAEPFRTDK